jgi:hypothetical protein
MLVAAVHEAPVWDLPAVKVAVEEVAAVEEVVAGEGGKTHHGKG